MERKPERGQVVVTLPRDDTRGFIVAEENMSVRKAGIGRVLSFVPGHGGDVWFVEHPDRSIGAYSTKEFAPPETSLSFDKPKP